MNRVELVDLHFYAYHGCFEEEQIIGNSFIVNFWAEYDMMQAAKSDNIMDALNYQEVYNIIKGQMEIKSHLLENVAYRILNAIKEIFPNISAGHIKNVLMTRNAHRSTGSAKRPIGMCAEELTVSRYHFRLEPNTEFESETVDTINKLTESSLELIFIDKPITKR
jgi:dihydroneopterin aldolase